MGHQGQISIPEGARDEASYADDAASDAPEMLLGIRRSIAELMPIRTRPDLINRAASALCTNTLFERVFVSMIDGRDLKLVSICFEDCEEAPDMIAALWKAEPPALTHLIIESEVARQSRAILVRDTRRRTIGGRLGRAIASDSYVAGPITSDGRCVGMVHADRKATGVAVGEADRDGLWMYCQALSLCIERVELAQRLAHQRGEVRRYTAALDAMLDSVATAPTPAHDLAEASEMQLASAGVVLAPEHRIRSLLTTREFEVLELMAEGRTNAEIAAYLVIAEGTVKSHVKHVLRKLRVGNRTEAVTRYLKMTETVRD
jgi:DNA-binding CsgD family transcriptional regulator